MSAPKIDAAEKLRQLIKDAGAMTPQISSLLSRLRMDRDHAQLVCAETYVIMGDMAHTLGLWRGPKMEQILDNLAAHRLVHKDILPFTVRDIHEYEPHVIQVTEKLYKLMRGDADLSDDDLRRMAEKLEGSNMHLLEDVYGQCQALIDPLVQEGHLPGSVVESVQMLVESYREQHGMPTDINPDGAPEDDSDEDADAA